LRVNWTSNASRKAKREDYPLTIHLTDP